MQLGLIADMGKCWSDIPRQTMAPCCRHLHRCRQHGCLLRIHGTLACAAAQALTFLAIQGVCMAVGVSHSGSWGSAEWGSADWPPCVAEGPPGAPLIPQGILHSSIAVST